jgi:DNA-binding protein YbaB
VPCIFCLAVFAMLAGTVTTLVLDQMEARLSTVAATPVRRTVDSASAATFETTVRSGGREVPVAVTVYKKYRRVRIQVMTHELSRAEAEAVEDLIARALDLRIVDRSDAHDEEKVREAFGIDPEELTVPDAEAVPASGENPARRPR